MWWLYYNASQLVTLIAAFGFLPHYTVAFKPFFEFIVLGIVPGTSFKIGFVTSLLLLWALCAGIIFTKLIRTNARRLQVQP